MQNKESLLYAVMLSELPQVGERIASAILARSAERGHGLASFFRLPAAVLRRDYSLPLAALRCLEHHAEAHRRRCEWLSANLHESGGWACTLLDPDYPRRLRHRADAPPVLFFFGDPTCAAQPTIAPLHSRTPTEGTVGCIRAVVEAAARAGFAVVTSTGKAAYRLVGVTARALSVPRLVVLDRGLFSALGVELRADPFAYRGAAHPCAPTEHGQLVCSPFRLLDHALPRSGRRRDALVAALADVIFALHARPGGEIERLCLAALEQGQPVLSWHGENPALLSAGAIPISGDDLRHLHRFVPISR
ncbi:MAG: DNA-processing protein DprA [Candidatus Binatia bacterium]|nr:DNA-processing protein DprA [Candidatus Binatia bacterium]